MKAGGGDNCIVLNVNSVLSHPKLKLVRGFRSIYAASKHAVAGVTSSLRGEIIEQGLADKIRVMVSLHPSTTPLLIP